MRWALALKGVDCEFVTVDLARGAQYKPEHLVRNPLGLVPVLERVGYPMALQEEVLANWRAYGFAEAGK